MLVEGAGLIRPTPIAMAISRGELAWLKSEAESREKRRGYYASYQTWKQGIIRLPTFVGMVGEHVVCRYFSQKGLRCEIDLRDAAEGDGDTDIALHGVKIQVKTRTRESDVLIRRLRTDGKLMPLSFHVAVSVTWKCREEYEPLTASIDGWILKQKLLELAEYVPGRAGPWRNLELCDNELLAMSDLIKKLQTNRMLGKQK